MGSLVYLPQVVRMNISDWLQKGQWRTVHRLPLQCGTIDGRICDYDASGVLIHAVRIVGLLLDEPRMVFVPWLSVAVIGECELTIDEGEGNGK